MKMRKFICFLAFLFGVFVIDTSFALTYPLPANGNVIGSFQKVKMNGKQTLLDVARAYDIGVHEILAHNRGMSLHRVYPRNTTVTVPSRFVLPSGPRQGIVLNLNQMRLFYYHGSSVSTYPVGIGRMGWSTPKGQTQITSKVQNPSWHPPASIRREAARKGKHLRAVIPPGPRNPLGHYAMHLGIKGILIHGTIQPSSIGTRSSHGCIRMYPHNIQTLYGNVGIGTPVRIVSEQR